MQKNIVALLILMIVSPTSPFRTLFEKNRINVIPFNMVDISKQSVSSGDTDKMLLTIEELLKEAESGNFEELRKRGFSVSSKNEAEALLERISDPILRDQILGQISVDELELLEDMKRVSTSDSFEGYEGGDIDDTLFEEIQQEASATLDNIRKGESSMGTLLGNEFADIVKGIDPSKAVQWEDESGTKNILSYIPTDYIMDAPPERSPANHFEVEELEVDSESNNENDNDILNEAILKKAFESELSVTENVRVTNTQDMFSQLLKVTMQSAEEEAAAAPEDVVKTTIDMISKGSTEELDVRAILGEAMASMADQLGVDIKGDILDDPSTKSQLNAIMATSMSELAKNFEELDEESKELYAKLDRLQSELGSTTQEFEEAKQEELDALLAQQSQYKTEMINSAKKVKESTDNLERLMSDLDQNADVMTALALFPIKRTDQKVTFVLGLALLFKVPFDIFQLIAVRSTDPSDWLTIVTQTGLCLAFLNNYGLLSAIFKNKNNNN